MLRCRYSVPNELNARIVNCQCLYLGATQVDPNTHTWNYLSAIRSLARS